MKSTSFLDCENVCVTFFLWFLNPTHIQRASTEYRKLSDAHPGKQFTPNSCFTALLVDWLSEVFPLRRKQNSAKSPRGRGAWRRAITNNHLNCIIYTRLQLVVRVCAIVINPPSSLACSNLVDWRPAVRVVQIFTVLAKGLGLFRKLE